MNREADERRDLDNKGLGQNKMLCSSFRSQTATMQAPRRSLRQEDRSPSYPPTSGS